MAVPKAVELREAQVGTITAEQAVGLGLPPFEREAVWGVNPDGRRVTLVGDRASADMLRAALRDEPESVSVLLSRFPMQRPGWPAADG